MRPGAAREERAGKVPLTGKTVKNAPLEIVKEMGRFFHRWKKRISNIEQGMSNYEVLCAFCLAVLMLLTNIEISWLFSSVRGSSCDADFAKVRLCYHH